MGRLGEIFRAHGAQYSRRFADRMSADQLRAMSAIQTCHTPAAGALLWRCAECERRHFTFQACGNRHCPACGKADAEQWLHKQCALLLPAVTYHLVTFTVHPELRRTIRSQPRELLDMLMKTAAATLQDLCANPRLLGGMAGMTAVLHTWTRQLAYHPHVHFIVTGGALDERGQWRPAHPKYLLPVSALSSVFRARMRDAFKKDHPALFARIKPGAWKDIDWVVHSEPVGSGQKAYQYLARYLYRVALTDAAILQHDPDRITLRYRDSNTNKPRTLRLHPQEFMRRFLQHVLPSRFCKVRYYGLHHSSKRKVLAALQAAMALTFNQPLPQPPPEPDSSAPPCPKCQAPMVFDERLSLSEWLERFPGLFPPRGPP
jgi:hypothetical protein